MDAPLVPEPQPDAGATPLADWARHAGWVLGWFRRRFGGDRAEDLAQEAFVALLRNRHRVRGGNEAGYLLGIVRMLSRSEGRRARSLVTVEHLEEPAAPSERANDDEAVAEAVRRLPPELEQVIVVHFGEQASYEQTAAVLGVPRATVQSRLRRALQRLRRELTRQGIGS